MGFSGEFSDHLGSPRKSNMFNMFNISGEMLNFPCLKDRHV